MTHSGVHVFFETPVMALILIGEELYDDIIFDPDTLLVRIPAR